LEPTSIAIKDASTVGHHGGLQALAAMDTNVCHSN
jgi:hypothetical protein